MPSVEPGGNCSWPGLLTTRRTPFWPFAVGVVRTRPRAERADERRRGAAPGAKNVLEPEAAAIVREKMSARDALLRLLKRTRPKKNARSLAMARAIESLVATAGAAIEKLQAHATSARALEAEARARLDALPPSADDDLPGAVKTRATLRVVCRSLHARLRETLRALEGARAAVDAALLAHHRGKTHVPGVAAAPSAAGSHEGDVRAFAASLARIVEEAEEDGLFAPLPRLPELRPEPRAVVKNASETAIVIEPSHLENDSTHLPDALLAELSLSLGAGARRADPATLRLVVATLAAAERDVDARAALAHEIETRFRTTSPGTSPGTSYSSENFAYGTTSLRAWTRVVAECPALSAAMRALARDAERDAATFAEEDAFLEHVKTKNGESSRSAQLRRLEERSRCVVFGSSTGWLVFYAALAHGVRSVGYELLEGRVATARATARAAFSFSAGTSDACSNEETFRSENAAIVDEKKRDAVATKARRACSWVGLLAFSSSDATLAPLGVGAKVVVLTSQCWDESLKTRVAERLASELKPGALVVDYGERLAREPAFGEPLAVVEAPTSWNAKQRFYVFQKREMTAVSEASE